MANDLRALAMTLVFAAAAGAAGCDETAQPLGSAAAGTGSAAGTSGGAGDAAGVSGIAGNAAGMSGGAGAAGYSGSPIPPGGLTGQAGDTGGTADCPCPSDTSDRLATARQPLRCLCDGTMPSLACHTTPAAYGDAAQCEAAAPGAFFGIIRWTGCGKIAYGKSFGLGSEAVTFDASTGAVVGIDQGGDSGWGQCSLSRYVYGDTIESCADAKACFVCGNFNFCSAPPCN